jgi:uncharacterized protein YuzE
MEVDYPILLTDPTCGASYIVFAPSDTIHKTVRLPTADKRDLVYIDYNEAGEAIGIEFLDVINPGPYMHIDTGSRDL